jgi:hypothetical protein
MFIVAAVWWVLNVSLSEQQKPVLYMLIMFMDAAIWWDLDISLFEQETSAMFILFMDAAVRWVLDVSLSEQQTCAIYIFSDNVRSRCSRVGHRRQPL